MILQIKNRALGMLARREHSCAELARKLARYGYLKEEIDTVIGDLQKEGLLSDTRFAQAFVATKATKFGAVKLRYELRVRGVDDELIDTVLRAEETEDEPARAQVIWQRKFGELPVDARDYARQARFLMGRGFSAETIRKVLKGDEA